MMGMPRSTRRIAAFVAMSMALGGPTWAAGIQVLPGAGTLQAAINAAQPKDTLKLAPGIYTGAVVVDRALKIMAKGPRGSTWRIDGECATATTLTITADHVSIKGGPIGVVGATDTQMRVVNVPTFSLKEVFVSPNLESPCGTEQHGLQIVGGSTKAKIDVSAAFNPVGVIIDGIPAGSLRARLNAFGNDVQLRISNSGSGAALGASGIRIARSFFSTGGSPSPMIELVASDGVQLTGNDFSMGANGTIFALDAQSDRNLISANSIVTGGVNVIPLINAGVGNCGKNNDFAVPPCP